MIKSTAQWAKNYLKPWFPSTVLYAAPIQCVSHILEIKKVQNSFYKLLSSPSNTPGYAVRQRLSLDSMQLTIFKLLFNFLIKILRMADDRLPNICLIKNRLDGEKNKILFKYYWAKQIEENFFICINELNISKNVTLETLISEKKNLINKMSSHVKRTDCLSCLNSSCLLVSS